MRMMAMNGMMNGANPAMMGGGGFAPGMMGGGGFAPGMVGGGGFAPGMVGGGGFAPGMMGGGGFAPGMMGGGGFAPGMMGGGGAGFAGQPVAQVGPSEPGAPAYAYQPLALPPSPIGVSNVFPVPAANAIQTPPEMQTTAIPCEVHKEKN
ncbi:unnamed protein product [Arctogadus glacialis]